MTKHFRADGAARGRTDTAPIIAVASLRPALADIPGAIDYLGKPSRSKFYADILPKLDIVKLGARTMVTVESLDRLIAANQHPAGR